MVIKRNLHSKRKGRPNLRRNGFARSGNFDNKPKGNASKVLERYLSLARDANSNGDKIKAEGFYQYAEHYQRVINAQPVNNSLKDKNIVEQNENKTNLSRTERAENAKIQKFNNVKDYKDEKVSTSNDADKTADGVEALKAFNTSADESTPNNK